MHRSAWKIRILIMLAIAAFSVISYWSKSSVNPVTGEKQRISLTQQQEVAMGLQSAPQMAQQFGGLYRDERVQQTVKGVGRKIVASSVAGRSGYPFDFHVLADERTVNAFALPGGQIFDHRRTVQPTQDPRSACRRARPRNRPT